MTSKSSPITPPPELVQRLCDAAFLRGADGVSRGEIEVWLIQKAFAAGADQELDACCEWANATGWEGAGDSLRAALATPSGPPKNCWLDDEPDLCPSPCVFEDPSEVISDCTYACIIKCKTDCQYYRVAIPPPEPTTSQITFNDSSTEEVIRLDKEGFHYKGQFIADAGEAHRLMLAFLKQHAKDKPAPPTDDEGK